MFPSGSALSTLTDGQTTQTIKSSYHQNQPQQTIRKKTCQYIIRYDTDAPVQLLFNCPDRYRFENIEEMDNYLVKIQQRMQEEGSFDSTQ